MHEVPRVLLLMETSRGYGRSVLRGIAQYARTQGPWMTEMESPFYVSEQSGTTVQDILLRDPYDGVIMRDWQSSEAFLSRNIPCVFFSYRATPSKHVSAVTPDDEAIGAMVAEYFMARGFKNYAYLGYNHMYWSADRGRSFANRLAQKGFESAMMAEPPGGQNQAWAGEEVALGAWLERLEKPLALFTCNDDRALRALAACHLAGLRIPEDVAICGVDDDKFMCQFSYPPLSSVRLNLENAGYRAAQLLDRMMKGIGSGGELITVEPLQVTTRVSTDTLAVEDPEVSAAVRYIRNNARTPISVDEVVKQTHLSRRGLYDRFRRTCGHTIHEEITSVRIAEIEQLLLDTRLPVSEIALLVGFSSPEHIAQYFRKHRHLTPSEYRNRYASH